MIEPSRPTVLWTIATAFAALVAGTLAHRAGKSTLTKLKALAITILNPKWRADVTSVYHAWRNRGESKPDEKG